MMYAFDTNYLVRHLAQDDDQQCRKVAGVIETAQKSHASILILDLVLQETAWVMQRCYGLGRHAWAEVLDELLSDAAFTFEDSARLRKTLESYRSGKADFSDYLILGVARGLKSKLQTFDKRLKKEIDS